MSEENFFQILVLALDVGEGLLGVNADAKDLHGTPPEYVLKVPVRGRVQIGDLLELLAIGRRVYEELHHLNEVKCCRAKIFSRGAVFGGV